MCMSTLLPSCPLLSLFLSGRAHMLGTVGCASVVFLLSAIIICYKAIKRKPLRKEENGTSRGEYAMSIRNKKSIGTNNTVV
uniref:Uncharacterized protein n=1 Tax=Anabas testudineus TaxID=64144 RepID=A0AAQ6IR29_ANATE